MKLRKQLSVLVAVAMMIGCMPGFVFATETEETQTPTEQTTEVQEDEDQTIDSVVDEDEPEEVTEEEQEEETVETTEFDVESDVYTVEPANQSASITTWDELKAALENPDNANATITIGTDIVAPSNATYITPVNGVVLDMNSNSIRFYSVTVASDDSYMFNVSEGVTFTILHGSLRNGKSSSCAGAIMNNGNLYLEDVTLSNNTGKCGAIYSIGFLSLNDVTITYNTATITPDVTGYTQYLGGGIHSEGILSVQGTIVISDNNCHASQVNNVGKNLYLAANCVITIAGDLDPSSEICISGESLPNRITSGWQDRGSTTVFKSDNQFDIQVRNDGEVYFVVNYISRSWDNGIVKTPVTIYNSPVNFISNSELSEGTYYVSNDQSLNYRLNVSSGTVNLIVADGVALTVNGGIGVSEGATLNIYSQTNDSGAVIAAAGGHSAGIGGTYVENVVSNAGTINIYGGSVRAYGSSGGAGIGAASGYGVGEISIFGGTVVAVGDYGAGIGGGYAGAPIGRISIYGGTITSTGTNGGADIGGGAYCQAPEGSLISISVGIYGGKVILPNPATDASHIGFGSNDVRNTLSITFGEVCVYDGATDSYIESERRTTVCSDEHNTGEITITPCDHSSTIYPEVSITADSHNCVCYYCGLTHTEAHHYEDGVCPCGRVEGNAPQFVGHSVQLSGVIGLQYFFTLPDGAQNCYVTFEHDGTPLAIQATPERSSKPGSGTYYMVQLNLSTIQIADSFVPVIHYTINGDEEETVSGTAYSVMDYINWGVAENNITTSDSEKNILNRLADYGYYAQLYLSGVNDWRYGEAYTTVDLGREPMPQDLAEIRGITDEYAIEKNIDSNVFDSVRFSLRFGDQLSLRIIFKPATGATIDSSLFTVNDEPASVTRLSDGRYAVTITDISALNIAARYIIGYDGSTVEVSPLSYVNAMLYQESNISGQQCVCALYNYAEACRMIIQSNGN